MWGKKGWGGHRKVPTHPQPQDGMDTLTLVPDELCPVSCIPDSVSSMHHWPRPLHHCGRLGHRGTITPTSPLEKPHGTSLLWSQPWASVKRPLYGKTRSWGGRRHIVPSSSSHWLQHTSLLASTNIVLASQHGSLGRCSTGQAESRHSQTRGRMWSRRGQSPTSNTLALEPSPGAGKGLEKGTRPSISAKTDGNPGCWGQPIRRPGEHFCT